MEYWKAFCMQKDRITINRLFNKAEEVVVNI